MHDGRMFCVCFTQSARWHFVVGAKNGIDDSHSLFPMVIIWCNRNLTNIKNKNVMVSRFKDSKNFIVRLKNGFFSSVTHKMTVIKTLVNHIGPTVVNTQ